MTRKLMTIFGVLFILGALCFVEKNAVSHLTEHALAETHRIMEAIRANELDSASDIAKALDQVWDERGARLEMMINHRSTDDVRYALSRLLAALETGDAEWALIYASELEGGVEHVRERQLLTAENLL